MNAMSPAPLAFFAPVLGRVLLVGMFELCSSGLHIAGVPTLLYV